MRKGNKKRPRYIQAVDPQILAWRRARQAAAKKKRLEEETKPANLMASVLGSKTPL